MDGPPASLHSDDSQRWIAFGSIRLSAVSADGGELRWSMIDSPRRECFPNEPFSVAQRRRWLRIEQIHHALTTDQAVLRVYVLPEDVDRSARASVKDLRRTIKWLLTFVDTADEPGVATSIRRHHRNCTVSLLRIMMNHSSTSSTLLIHPIHRSTPSLAHNMHTTASIAFCTTLYLA